MNNPGGASQSNISILLTVQANQQAAQQAQQTLQKTRTHIDDLGKSMLSLKRVGRDLREIGDTFAVAGAAFIAPFLLAANQYAERFKSLEPIANNFAQAQKRQADATTELGRVAAQALIPTMNQVAALEKKIADFATAHPEFVQAAINIGTTMAAGGAALAVAGQIASTFARIQEIVMSGSLVGNLGKSIISIAAIGVAADLTQKAIQAYGKSIGDQNLANFDAMKVLREAIVGAADTILSIIGIIDKGTTDFVTGILATADKFAQGMLDVINGIFDVIHKILPEFNVPKLTTGIGTGGKDPIQTLIDVMNSTLNTAIKNISADKTNLALGAPTFVATGSLGTSVDSALDPIKKLIDKITGLLGGSTASGPTAGGASDQSDSIRAFIGYQQQIRQSEITLAQERLAAQKQFANESAKLERDRAAQIKLLEADQNRARAKAQLDFNHNEVMVAERLAFERKNRLYQMGLQANELAAQGDVAGFIAAQRQNRIELMVQDRQNAFDKTQRKEQFDFQQQQQDAANKVAIAQQRAQFGREDIDRRTAYNQQIAAQSVAHQNQLDEMQRNFAKQLAALQDNVLGLNSIQNAAYAQNVKDARQFFIDYGATLRSGLMQALGYTPPALTQVGGGNTGLPPGVVPQNPRVPAFASGTNYVPHDMMAYVHRGEIITPANQAGRGGMNFSFDFSGMSIGAGVNHAEFEGTLHQFALDFGRQVAAGISP